MIKRKNYAKIKECFELPNLLEVQISSFKDFLQADVPKTKRANQGLQEVFNEIFPIESFDGEYRVEFVNYSIDRPKYEIEECLRRGMTYASPLKVRIRLKSKKETKEQEVYMGDLPLMTDTGTFIINGDERVTVSQLHRSPGVSLEEELFPNGKRIHSTRIIPYRGAWMEFEFDASGILHVFIDRKRKILSTVLLRAIGYSTDEDILKEFCGVENVKVINSLDHSLSPSTLSLLPMQVFRLSPVIDHASA